MNKYDLIIIGGGPAGYYSAIRASQLGMKVAVFEKSNLGGTCLNVGCIPTKTLFHSAELASHIKDSGEYGVISKLENIDYEVVIDRKDKVVENIVGGVKHLMKKNSIDVITGTAEFDTSNTIVDKVSGKQYNADNILIATGTENALPPIPGIQGDNVIDSTKLLSLKKMPKSMVVIGGGVIGCEFANILNAFGCEVTIVEMLPEILANMDEDLAKLITDEFNNKGVSVMTNTKVTAISDNNGLKEVVCIKDGDEIKINAEYVLVAAGRRPRTDDLNLDKAGIDTDRGFVSTNSKMETSVPGVYAAGDVAGKSLLAHTAFEEGYIAAENMKGANKEMKYNAVPSVVFVETEIASVGLTEKEARDAGHEVIVGRFNLANNGKAAAMGKSMGLVKVVSENKNHEILGMHIAGPSASELITIGASLITMEAVLEDVIDTIYPHPSVTEAIKEACMNAMGCAIHA